MQIQMALLAIAIAGVWGCASQTKLRLLEDHPGFVARADTVHVTKASILSKPTLTQKARWHDYSFANAQTADTLVIQVKRMKGDSFDSHLELQEFGWHGTKEGTDVNAYRILIRSTSTQCRYIAVGSVTTDRTISETSKSTTLESVDLKFPIEFTVFEAGEEVGLFVFHEPTSKGIDIDATLRDSSYMLSYDTAGSLFTSTFSVQQDHELLGLIELKPKGSKKRGEALLRHDIAADLDGHGTLMESFVIGDVIAVLVDEATSPF